MSMQAPGTRPRVSVSDAADNQLSITRKIPASTTPLTSLRVVQAIGSMMIACRSGIVAATAEKAANAQMCQCADGKNLQYAL